MNGNVGGNPCLILGEISPITAGQLTGDLILWLGILAGLVKCWHHSHRHRTNKKCALALMFFLLTLFIPLCVATTTQLLGAPSPAGLTAGLTGLAMMGTLVTALVLAILGLVEVSRNPDIFKHGQTQALWALALSVLLVWAMVVSLMVRFSTRGWVNHSPAQASKFEEENFEFTAPGSPWVSMNAAKVNKEAKLAFMRQFPETWFLVVADKVGLRAGFSTQQYADLCKEHLRAVAGDSMHLISETPLEINGLKGIQDEIEARVAAHAAYFKQWYAVTNGYAYELTAWGSSANRPRIAEDAGKMLHHFKQIDPRRVATTSGKGFAENFVSLPHNYQVNVTNSVWFPSPTLEKSFPYADFSASQGDSCLTVVPVWLGERKISLDALTAAFLATLNVEYPNEQLTHRQRLKAGHIEGVVYDFTREVDGTPFKYRFKIVQGDGNAIMVAAWTQRKAPDAEGVLNDALNRVEFDVPSSPQLDPTPEYSEREHKTLGFVLNQAGLFHLKAGEYEPALPLFCAAIRANQQEPVYLQNALQTWRNLERPKEALAFLEQQPAASLALPAVRANQAYFQAQADNSDLAVSNYAAVFAAGYRNDLHFATYVNLLDQQHQYDRALKEVRSYLEVADSISTRLLEAAIYRGQKNFPKAISLLQAQRESAPDNSQIARALAETFLQAGQFNEALTLSRGLLENHGNSANDYFLKGRSELGLKWYREARTSFEAAARLAPASKEIRSYLDLINGLLGEGDNSLVREAIEPVGLPASLTNPPDGPAPEGYATNYGAYYARRIVALSYVAGKECKTTEYELIRVLNACGVSAFSTVQIYFDPLSEQLFANDIRVLGPDGKTISVGSVDNFYVLDDRTSGTASQKKILNLPVSGLQTGCQLAVTITRRTLGSLTEFPFLEHTFAATFPTRESILFIKGDLSGLQYRSSPPLEPAKLAEGLTWRVLEPVTARWEPMQPTPASFLPMVWIGDAAAHWPDIASNYLASISDRLQPDPSLRELVHNVVGGAVDPAAKVAALSRYVQTNYTYKALEFGRRSRIPNPPAEIIRNKYGDCKDHAVLLQQMLVAAEVPAWLALVNTRDLIQPDLPSLDQFNHVIVYAGDRFLDCTSKGAEVAQTIPFGQAGRKALILDSQNPRFVTIPPYPANASTIEVQQRLHLVERTDLAVDETLSLSGVAAAGLRDYLRLIPMTSLKTTLQNQFGMSDAVLEDVHVESLETPSAPLRLKFKYLLKQQFHPLGNRLTGTLRAGFARSYLAPAATDDRRTPFEAKIPTVFRSTVTLEAPDGFQAELPDPAENKLDPRFATAKLQTRLTDGGLQLEFECQESTGRFAASDYAAYQETMNQALSLLEKTVVFKAGGR